MLMSYTIKFLITERLKSIQYNLCVALTGAIRDMLKEKKLLRIGIGVPLSLTLM